MKEIFTTDSKDTTGKELRTLPEGWGWKSLRDVLSTIESGGRPKGGARGIANGIPSLGGEHLLYNGNFDFQEIRYIPNDYYAKMTRGKIRKHDVLVVKDGATTGKTSFVGDHFPFVNAAVNEHVFILRPAEVLLSKYLFYWFQSPFGQDCIADNFRGAAQGGITLGILDNSRFPLAPIDVQERIVVRLEELLSDLEAGVAALERVRTGVKRYKASVLKSACEGMLLGDWEIEDGVLPKGWSWTKIDPLLSTTRTGLKTGPFGSLLKKHEHREKGVPVLGIENIGAKKFVHGSKIHITQEKAKQLAGYAALPGDILISRSGTVGEVCVVPDNLGEARISTNVMRVVLNQEIMLPEFFIMLFNGAPSVLDQVAELCKGSTRAFLNQSILNSIVFPLPPLEEQHHIGAEVERRLESARAVEAAVQAGLKRAGRLRQAVLKAAFEGKFS